MTKIKIKLNRNFRNFTKGKILTIDADDQGQPLDKFWFRRLQDSKLDNCIEIVTEKKKKDQK